MVAAGPEGTRVTPWQDARSETAQAKRQKGNATMQVRLTGASQARLPLHALRGTRPELLSTRHSREPALR